MTAPRAQRDGVPHRAVLGAAIATVVVLVSGLFAPISPGVAVPASSSAAALNVADFDPGLIISDEIFFNYESMTVAEIQDFLDATGPTSCTNCLR